MPTGVSSSKPIMALLPLQMLTLSNWSKMVRILLRKKSVASPRAPFHCRPQMKFVANLLILLCGVSFAEEKKGYDTPLLPDGKHRVHDLNRVKPRVVETQGAVQVPPPADAKILFDGSNLDAWKDPKWIIKDGLLVANERDLLSKDKYGDLQVHLEWRIPAGRKVNGQTGGNSGIFFMNRYEVQILQSHKNVTYADGQAGAIYGQYPPLVNATAPQGEWQSYDIVFIAPRYENGEMTEPAKLTLFHNGVLLHNAKPYQGPTKHKNTTGYPKNHPAEDIIRMQWHGDPIEFRNIWIRGVGDYDQPSSGLLEPLSQN